MDENNKNGLYWLIGLGAVAFIIWKYRKVKSPVKAQAGNLQAAKAAYDRIQQLYGSVPKGGKLPPPVLDQVVALEMEIEKNGFTVENNTLVKLT